MKRLYKPDPIPKTIDVPPLVRVPYRDEGLKQKQAAKLAQTRTKRWTEEERQAARDRRLLKQVAKMLGKA
jgi:hypothetical protein